MKKVFFLLLTFLSVSTYALAGEEGGIRWMTLDEAQVEMAKKPKKVLIDMYTDWCGWCKKMDEKTFSNPELAAYVNENFYPIKFNTESPEPIRFMGKMWETQPGTRTNQLAIELLHGKMGYPTTMIMDEGFTNGQPIPGYLNVPTMEAILHYLVEGHNKGAAPIPFPEFQKRYVPKWKVLVK